MVDLEDVILCTRRNNSSGIEHYEKYHKNGKLRCKWKIYQHHYVGEYCTFYPSGDKRCIRHYDINGKLDGFSWIYNTEGNIVMFRYYKSGEDLTDKAEEIIGDIYNVTDEEKLLVNLSIGV